MPNPTPSSPSQAPRADASDAIAGGSAGNAALGNERYTSVWTRRILIALGIYFIARIFVRIDISNTPEMDEAEQLIQGQHWAWGYGPQPPLYTWIQKLFFAAFGFNLFALTLLKNLLLFATCAVTAAAGREFARNRAGGLLAASGLFFVPHFVWSSQNDLTHSIMAVLFVALTIWILAILLRAPTWSNYSLLAVFVACGVLSKYNYVAFFLVLLLAMASVPEARRTLFNRKLGFALCAALLLLAPHLNWMWQEPELAFRKLHGLHAATKTPLWQSWIHGFTTLAVSLAAYFAPMALICGLAHRRWPKLRDFWPAGNESVVVQLARHIVLLSILFFVLAALLFQARFKERWIHPNMFVLPLLLASIATNWPRIVVKRFVAIAGVVAMLVFLILPGRVLFAAVTGQPHRQNLPYAELLEGVFVGRGDVPLVLASPNSLGGAAKLRNPGTIVVTSGEVPAVTNCAGPVLIVWDASQKGSRDSLKGAMKRFDIPEEVLDSAQFVEAPLKYVPNRTLKLGFVFALKPAGKGESTQPAQTGESVQGK